MEKVVIQEQLRKCPGMIYDPDNNTLEIKGRSIPENPEVIFRRLNEWVSMHFSEKESLSVDIKLEYINSGSSKKLFYLLKVLDTNTNIRKLIVNWYYEEGDEETLVKGQVFSESLPKTEFRFHLQKDVV